jgi:hypothetical protein
MKMNTQLDALAAVLEARGFTIDRDGDGHHLEIMDYPEATVFIECFQPDRQDWLHLWDNCSLHVDADNETNELSVRSRIIARLADAHLTPVNNEN